MISTRNLTRRYGPVIAVDDVSLDIERGQIVGLLGHNGAGKTTVMKILTGYLEPSSGSVSVGGVDVAADRIGAQRLIGYLPENAPLYPEMLVQEYLRMMAELRGLESGGIDRAIADAAGVTGLADHLVHPIGTLSKGYQQRVGLAQAILHEPDVLVLDEPTNGLDPVQIQSIRQLIRRLGERATIILSTHILQEIEAVCERVLVMIQGALVADASLDELLSSDVIAVSLESGAADVAARLGRLPGVGSVEGLGEDPRQPGFTQWAVECSGGGPGVPAIIAACSESGWTIASVAPQIPTLERVFADLQTAHVASKSPEAA